MKYYNSDIVFQEIPDETTLAINICGCPNRCEGCHSKWLWDDVGMPLFEGAEEIPDYSGLEEVVGKYARNISCVCFMGGDQSPETVDLMARRVKSLWPSLKIGWYSGRPAVPDRDESDISGTSSTTNCFGATQDSYAKTIHYDATEIQHNSRKQRSSDGDAVNRDVSDNRKSLYEALQERLPEINIDDFDFIKLGPYIAALGGLRSKTTNQRIYRILDGKAEIIHIHNPHDFGQK